MKQFEILSGRCLVVELPEGAHSPLIEGINVLCELTYIDEWGYDYCSFRLPPSTWEIVGMLPEVTEMDAIPLVDKERFIVDGPDLGFRNYKGNKYDWFGTALESLDSAILAEGYYLDENPKRIIDHDSFYDGNGRLKDEEWYTIKCETEADAQERVLDRSRCLLLGRED